MDRKVTYFCNNIQPSSAVTVSVPMRGINGEQMVHRA